MGTTINHMTVRRPQRTTGVPQRCPACGGLECLCRPRFFAGQLLTEEDLNRLDHYIVAKQKLHNRYLHGWGVVCGLDVVCDDCGEGSVIVQSGYALSPCGEDVIVCGDQRVPVCELIDDCRKPADPDCDAPTRVVGCDDPIQEWILAICYAETPSRGVAPLRTSGGCGCGCSGNGGCGGGCSGGRGASGGCGCSGGYGGYSGSHSHGGSHAHVGGHPHGTSSGGQGDCGCGCGGTKKGTVATTSASKGASLVQCENTVVCESYRFKVYKKPRTPDRTKQIGAMAEAFLACVKAFTDAMPDFDATITGQQELHDWCCAVHDAFADWFAAHPPYACELARRIAAIRCPDVGDPDFDAAIAAARSQFLLAALEVLLSCLCTALMPPCPPAPMDDCVPLAVVTVRTTNGCRVISICNWTTHRKYVTTFPSLQYWLSVFPFGRLLREALENLCCKPFLRRGYDRYDYVRREEPAEPGAAPGIADIDRAGEPEPRARAAQPNAADVSPASYFRASALTTARSRAFMRLALEALGTRERSASAEELVLGMLGERKEDGTPYLTELESENLLQHIVLDQMAKPLMRNLASDQLSGFGGSMLGTIGAMMGGPARGDASTDASVGARLDELRATVERQQAQIDELLRARDR